MQILGEPERYFSNPGISVTVMKSVYQSIPQPPQTVQHTFGGKFLTQYKGLGSTTVRKTTPPFCPRRSREHGMYL